MVLLWCAASIVDGTPSQDEIRGICGRERAIVVPDKFSAIWRICTKLIISVQDDPVSRDGDSKHNFNPEADIVPVAQMPTPGPAEREAACLTHRGSRDTVAVIVQG